MAPFITEAASDLWGFTEALSESRRKTPSDLVSRSLHATAEQRKFLYDLLYAAFVVLLPETKEKTSFPQTLLTLINPNADGGQLSRCVYLRSCWLKVCFCSAETWAEGNPGA